MIITDEVRAYAREQARGRCECEGSNCRHHRTGGRCKRGLRPGQWKVYWHSEKGGMSSANLDAWCLDCFANNFTIPTSSVTVLFSDIVGYEGLADADRRKAITAMAVLRDAADRVAAENQGRLLNTEADEVRLEFAKTPSAVAAARVLHERFQENAAKLNLPLSDLHSGIHCGQVTRSRDGDLFGDTLGFGSLVKGVAEAGQIVLSGSVVEQLGNGAEVEDLGERAVEAASAPVRCWVLRR